MYAVGLTQESLNTNAPMWQQPDSLTSFDTLDLSDLDPVN